MSHLLFWNLATAKGTKPVIVAGSLWVTIVIIGLITTGVLNSVVKNS